VTDLNPLGRVNPVEPILDDNEEVLNQDQVDVEVLSSRPRNLDPLQSIVITIISTITNICQYLTRTMLFIGDSTT
jgi:hypothetical protein